MYRSIVFGQTLLMQSTGCRGLDNEVRYLEHVVAKVTLQTSNRGSVSVYLTSPRGTSSNLLQPRIYDDDDLYGFTNWPFMTVHNWGEDPEGTWMLKVNFRWDYSHFDANVISSWNLTMYGTKEPPLSTSPCHTECNGCTGPGNDQCLSCLNFSEKRGAATQCVPHCTSGMLPLYTLNGRDIRCVNECADGTYNDTNRCLPCGWACLACSKSLSESPTCSTCRDRYFKYMDTCVAACPDGYYGDRDGDDKYRCITCHWSCSTCRGPESTDCTSCKDGEMLQSNSCVQPCPDGQYRSHDVTIGSFCDYCSDSCETCSGPEASQCLSCSKYNSLVLSNGMCKSCPDGTYFDWPNNCAVCGNECRQCSETRCFECYDGYKLTYQEDACELEDSGSSGSRPMFVGTTPNHAPTSGFETPSYDTDRESNTNILGSKSKANTLGIVFGSLGAVVVVIGTAIAIRICSRRNSHSQAQRSWRSVVTVRRGDSDNTQMMTSVGESFTAQLLEENPSASPTSV